MPRERKEDRIWTNEEKRQVVELSNRFGSQGAREGENHVPTMNPLGDSTYEAFLGNEGDNERRETANRGEKAGQRNQVRPERFSCLAQVSV